jgi:dnd system-associated protein 4
MARSDRAAVEPEMWKFYKELSEGNDVETVPFKVLKDIFMLAVCLGFSMKKRRPLSEGRQAIIRFETFAQSTDVPVLHAIAIADTGDVEILDQGFEFLTIAEEYANEGIRFLTEKLLDQRGLPLWNLVELIQQGETALSVPPIK